MKSITIKKKVKFQLTQTERDKMFRMTNKYFTGSEVVPKNQEVTEAHKDAHWSINAVKDVELTIRLFEDGSWEVV